MPNKDIPNFGLLLRDYREITGWSQTELARQLARHGFPISVSAVHKYELGHRRPGGDFVAFLEQVFQLSDEETLGFLEALSIDYLIELIDEYAEAKQRKE